MEKVPEENPQVKVARLVGNFVSQHACFEVDQESGLPKIVIFRHEDLAALPFDENGEISMEEFMGLLPKGIFPSYN